jgi:tetratricopeptide (TPR) repeat protein
MARVPLPDDVEARELDMDVRKQLMSLSKDTADVVARHLVMAGRLMDEEPEQALAHARAARALAGRVGAVREANGLVAYTAGEWAESLSELRTARRLTGEPDHLAVMADCERALGRPDRALIVAEDPQAKSLSPAARVELMIVASGARRDLGQPETAVVSLQVPALEGPVRPWTARLRYAYADALLDAGREDEARTWFARAAEVDEHGETDADERVLELDGVILEDLQADDENVEMSTPAHEADVTPEGSTPAEARGMPAEVVAEPSGQLAKAVAEVAEEDVVPVADAVAEPGDEPTDADATAADGTQAWREAPVVPDSEIPVLGKTGSTAVGFIQPPSSAEASAGAAEASAGEAERSSTEEVGRADVEGKPGHEGQDFDDLRLFD